MTTFSFSTRTKRPVTTTGFSCPHCRAPGTEVKDSRPTPGGRVRRRRTCGKCRSKFSTVEVLTDDLPSVDLMSLTLKSSTSLNLFIASFNELRRAIKTSARIMKEEDPT